jgi:membrane-associated phospholipid phosphatase
MLRKIDERFSRKLHMQMRRFFPIWKFLSVYAGAGYMLFFIGIVLGATETWRTAITMSFAVILTIFITFLIRYLVGRPRPFYMEDKYIPYMNDFSFPSAHASTVFSVATVQSFYFWHLGFSLSIPLVVFTASLAIAISISRVFLGVHYISDIIAGAILGSFISCLVIYLEFYL